MALNALETGFVAAQIGEAISSYIRSDAPLIDPAIVESEPQEGSYRYYEDDGDFWSKVSNTGEQEFSFYKVAISEWVARVPGLYWRPEAQQMRKIAPAMIENMGRDWMVYRPIGKSQKVSGGVGTQKFPPSENGYRMITLTTSLNASAGVPALISPEVWQARRLGEGSVISSRKSFRWQPIPMSWAREFPIVRGISRGCLFLDDPDPITSSDEIAPILVHPYSVMEYWAKETLLHDFVYASAVAGDACFRGDIEEFFEQYRKANGREGIYLTASDIAMPMWDAVFLSPKDMRENKAYELGLIEARLKDALKGEAVVEALLQKLASLPTVDDLRRISSNAGLGWRRWSQGGRLVDEVARLVAKAIETERHYALFQAVQMEFTQ